MLVKVARIAFVIAWSAIFSLTSSGLGGRVALAAGGWTPTGAMAAVHRGNTATVLNDGAVLVAGWADLDSSGEPSAELYRPDLATWSRTAALPMPRRDHTATLLADGRVLIAGGFQQGGGCFGCALNSVQIYDPASASWTTVASMHSPRYGHTATTLADGRILVAGGSSVGFTANSAEIYDPATDVWTLTGTMTAQREGHTATRLPGGQVLVAGGFGEFDVGYSASAELFTPSTGTWTRVAPMLEHRRGHTATLLSDGRILMVGGFNGRDVSTAEFYNPVTGTWTPAGAMSEPRAAHTATPLPDGTVLVVGGQNRITGALATAEIFDPTSGHWSVTASMSGARASHTAARLRDGTVLVAGGCPFSPSWACGQSLTAELYTLVSDTTAPVITLVRSPAPSAGGWNRTSVTVTWQPTDAESGIASTTGCDQTTLTQETSGTILTCSAQNGAGLSSTATTTVKIDTTPPTVAYSGNAGTYTIDQTVGITCDATDSLSGIATSSCAPIATRAYALPLGVTTFSASAEDNAGNVASGTITVTITVTPASLCRLTTEFVQSSPKYAALPPAARAQAAQLTTGLCAKVTAIAGTLSPAQKALAVKEYQKLVDAFASANWLTAAQAALLKTFASAL